MHLNNKIAQSRLNRLRFSEKNGFFSYIARIKKPTRTYILNHSPRTTTERFGLSPSHSDRVSSSLIEPKIQKKLVIVLPPWHGGSCDDFVKLYHQRCLTEILELLNLPNHEAIAALNSIRSEIAA
jgi:hypothetical protein